MPSVFRFFVAVFVLLASCSAHAIIPTQDYLYSNQGRPDTGVNRELQAACEAMRAWYAASLISGGNTEVNVTTGTCRPYVVGFPAGNIMGGSYKQSNGVTVQIAQFYPFIQVWSPGVCVANSTSASGGCKCNTGFSQSGNACISSAGLDPESLAGFCAGHAAASNTFPLAGPLGATAANPTTSCYMPQPPFTGGDATRGCMTNVTDFLKVPKGDGTYNFSATGVVTGQTCDGAVNNTGTPPPVVPQSTVDPCPGGFAGTVNGATVCAPAVPDKGIEAIKSTSTTDTSGTKRDVTETTKCLGEVCTTTTTTTATTSAGSITTTTSSATMPIADKCAKDPSNTVCAKTNQGTGTPTGSSGSGSSGTGCAANSSAAGCGGAAAGIGNLYTGKGVTVDQILGDAKTALTGSPLGGAAGSFFNVSAGGSCPASVWNIPYLNATISVNTFCTGFANNMFAVIRGVLLLIAGFMAFRIAIE